jgi:hypothetical protein
MYYVYNDDSNRFCINLNNFINIIIKIIWNGKTVTKEFIDYWFYENLIKIILNQITSILMNHLYHIYHFNALVSTFNILE